MVQTHLSGWVFNGQLVAILRSLPFGVNYKVWTDRSFKTRRARVERVDPDKPGILDVQVKRDVWSVNDQIRSDLQGCEDIDLEFSPVTNTLPIRRLRPRIGNKIDLTVAWVRFPSLKVQRLDQSYERLGKYEYRYRSGRGFSAKLDVDDFGLVNRYGKIWKRVR